MFRLGQIAALLFLAGLGFIDITAWRVSQTGLSTLVGLAEIAIAIAIAAIWLPAHRQNTRLLPALALAASVFSMLLTFAEGSVAGDWSSSISAAESAALLGLLSVVVRRSHRTLVWPAAIAVTAAIVIQPTALGLGSDSLALALAFALALARLAAVAAAAGAFARFQDVTRQRQLDTVRAEQRTEFARDLHDFIAHHVTGIVVQAQGARIIAEQDPKRVVAALEQIEKAGAETMASMRRMVGLLRQPSESSDTDAGPLTPLAGVAELQPLIDSFGKNGGPPAQLHVDGNIDGLPVEITSSAYRVVMEALTNIRKHARDATAVDVWVQRTPDWLLVRIANDGPPPRAGLTREAHGRFGLFGLTERLTAVGGHLQAGPGIDGGWIVSAGLPVHGAV